MRVLLGDAAVGRPAGMAEPGRRDGAVRAGRLLEVREVARPRGRSRARPPRAARSRPSHSPGTRGAGALKQQRLRRAAPDVSDDPAHPEPPFTGRAARCRSFLRKGPWKRKSPAEKSASRVGTVSRALVERASAMLAQASSATRRILGLREHPNEGLRARTGARARGRFRPIPRSARSTSSRIAGVSSRSSTRTFSFTCGQRLHHGRGLR